jgi:hypothetical protein
LFSSSCTAEGKTTWCITIL